MFALSEPRSWTSVLCGLLALACSEGSVVATGPVATPTLSRSSASVRVGLAASLRPVFDDLKQDFEARNPGVELQLEPGGSSALCRKALDMGTPYDILALADASLFPALLQPVWTQHHVLLASNRLVLARSAQAPGADLVGPQNFREVVLQDGVRLGMADPDRAPLGYRTLLSMRLAEQQSGHVGLAEKLRAQVGQRFVWPDAAALLAHLQSGEVDYAFLYAATAKGADLAFSELPIEMNLGSLDHAETYARASVSVVGLTPGSHLTRQGAPITYAVALGKSSENKDTAARFMAELIGPQGHQALLVHGFSPLTDHPQRPVGKVPEGPAETGTQAK